MIKKFLKLFFALCIICIINTMTIPAADVEFNLSASVDYKNSKIVITGITPARYRQLINVIIYKPENFSVPGDVAYPENPQSQFPLKSVGSIQRIENIHADITGEFSVEFKTAEIPSGYYIVSASGGGYMSDVSKDSELLFLSSEGYIYDIILPEISQATGNELKQAIENLKNDYEINPGSGYEKNQDKFISYFTAVRADDFLGSFESLGEVQKAFDGVNLIMATVDDTSPENLKTAFETENDTFAIFDKTDNDYVENSDEVYPILKEIAKETKVVFGIKDLRIMFNQAQGIATINTKTATSVTDSIIKYGDVLGIDVEEYLDYCEEYGEIEVNRAFAGRDFILPSEVVSAYVDRIEYIEKPSVGGGGSFGGGSGGGSSSGGGGSVIVGPSDKPSIEPSEINITSFAVSSEAISYTISVNDYRYSSVCVAIYSSNMKLIKVKLYNLKEQGSGWISGEILKDSNMKYFRVFCIDRKTLEPSCVNIEKRI